MKRYLSILGAVIITQHTAVGMLGNAPVPGDGVSDKSALFIAKACEGKDLIDRLLIKYEFMRDGLCEIQYDRTVLMSQLSDVRAMLLAQCDDAIKDEFYRRLSASKYRKDELTRK